jgi:uncharacterized protein YodC (DUF2158 family)
METLFTISPNGFFKFLKPNKLLKSNNNPDYKEGDSWEEELFFSVGEFRTAFNHIGTAYSSKKAYEDSEDKFNGKYYCSYYDRVSHKTYYFRNNQLVDQVINLFCGIQSPNPTKSEHT